MTDLNKVTRVALVDDHAWVRNGIRKLLEASKDIEIVGEASDGQQALTLIRDLTPDVVVLDMEMPVMSGLNVAQCLRDENSKTRILVLSAYDDIQFVKGMLEKGIEGYLIKDEAPTKIVSAVKGIAKGEKGWFSEKVAAKIE